MNYSKIGIILMFALSMVGLCSGFYFMEDFLMGSIVGFFVFLECSYVYVESIYSEYKWRKQGRKQMRNKPVIILNSVKPGRKLK